MEKKRQTRRVNIRREKSAVPLPCAEIPLVEDLIAGMIAAAFASEHPELFRSSDDETVKQQVSGSVAAAAEVTGAPPVNAAGPDDHMELEPHDEQSTRTNTS